MRICGINLFIMKETIQMQKKKEQSLLSYEQRLQKIQT